MKKLIVAVAVLALSLPAFAETNTYVNTYAQPDISGCSVLDKYEPQGEYCKKEYANRPLRETQVGINAILNGLSILGVYQISEVTLPHEKGLLDKYKNIESAALNHLSKYSQIWSDAIQGHSDYPDYEVEFDTALSITNSEFLRLGVQATLAGLKKSLMESMSEYDTSKYPNTFQLYGVLSQMIGLGLEPRGSLQSYNQTVNSLQTDFEKYYALAELENPLPKTKAKAKSKKAKG